MVHVQIRISCVKIEMYSLYDMIHGYACKNIQTILCHVIKGLIKKNSV